MHFWQALCVLAASALAVGSIVPYLRGVVAGTVRPHTFSWLIWTILTAVGLAGQIRGGAQWSSALFAVTTTLSTVVLILAFKHGDRDYTRGDWLTLGGAALAIALWPLIGAPLASVAVAAGIDLAGFIPTYSKARRDPGGEALSLYWLSAVKHVIGIAGLVEFNALTVMYPAALVLANATFVLAVLRLRRTTSSRSSS